MAQVDCRSCVLNRSTGFAVEETALARKIRRVLKNRVGTSG